jgi:hypothetical protein
MMELGSAKAVHNLWASILSRYYAELEPTLHMFSRLGHDARAP